MAPILGRSPTTPSAYKGVAHATHAGDRWKHWPDYFRQRLRGQGSGFFVLEDPKEATVRWISRHRFSGSVGCEQPVGR